jgi:hypothetical protein
MDYTNGTAEVKREEDWEGDGGLEGEFLRN